MTSFRNCIAEISVVIYNPLTEKFLLLSKDDAWDCPTDNYFSTDNLDEACKELVLAHTGLHIRIMGILSLKINVDIRRYKLKFVFYAQPISMFDETSEDVRWLTIDEFNKYYAPEVKNANIRVWFNYIARGGEVGYY